MAYYQFPVQSGHVLLFARAAGAPQPDCDDAISVPPTFVQASSQFDPDWPFRPRPEQPWLGSGRTATGDPSSGNGSILHAEQHFTYHKPLHAGVVLTVTTQPGKTWVKASRGGGELHFEEAITEYRDEVGDIVVEARSVAVTPVPAESVARTDQS